MELSSLRIWCRRVGRRNGGLERVESEGDGIEAFPAIVLVLVYDNTGFEEPSGLDCDQIYACALSFSPNDIYLRLGQ